MFAVPIETADPPPWLPDLLAIRQNRRAIISPVLCWSFRRRDVRYWKDEDSAADPMATTTIEHKRGDTFDRLLVIPTTYADGYWIGWTVTAQIRTARGKFISNLAPSWADPAADTRTLRLYDNDTQHWPVGDQEIDVQFVRTSDSTKLSTETLIVTVVHDVTQP